MDHLPFVQRIFNAERKTSLGVSPAQLLFGNAVQLDRGILFPAPPVVNGERPVVEYMEQMLTNQENLLRVAQATQLDHDEFQIARVVGAHTEFPVNSYVLYTHPAGQRQKLDTPKMGPYRVVNIVGSEYTIQDLLTGKNKSVHVKTLSPFNYEEEQVDPVQVAMHDQEEFHVERILAHTGNPKRKSEMEFKVRWTGYGAEEDTWEPWHALRDVAQLHEYLRNHGMAKLINKKFNN
jgi:hypothetical protein